ncbi:MAG TPA: cytochrome c [Candidatus Binatia bacterium]|nr:cytochrome c [Candidatus Binatia bacterium]
MNGRAMIAGVIGVLTLLFALAPLYRGEVELPTAEHHLLHAAIVTGAALSGVLAWNPAFARTSRLAPLWLLIAICAPILAMFLMWPSEYAFLDRHPGGHAIEHLGLVGLGFVTGYSGQRYAAGIGWATGAALLIMSLLAPLGYGVSPPPAAIAALPTAAPAAEEPASPSDAGRGAALYKQSCASCHGTSGEGGLGPSLKNERSRKDIEQTARWIRNPAPPMPKLFPATLTEKDVREVSAFVQKL